MSTSLHPDEIRRQMADIRGGLREDVEGLVETAREMTDWRLYVRRYPWAFLGAVVGLGFLAVPKRPRIVSPDKDALVRLAGKKFVVLRPEAEVPTEKGGWAAPLVAMLVSTAAREAFTFFGNHFKSYYASQEKGDGR